MKGSAAPELAGGIELVSVERADSERVWQLLQPPGLLGGVWGRNARMWPLVFGAPDEEGRELARREPPAVSHAIFQSHATFTLGYSRQLRSINSTQRLNATGSLRAGPISR